MIGFFGGSFDPVHYGHLKNAISLKKELNLDQLFLMPCAEPVHKNALKFSKEQRLDMLKLAVKEFSELSIDTREIDRTTPSYTIDSLKQIKQDYPNEKIFFIMGADSFESINTWKNHQQLSDYATLVVLPRQDNKIANKDGVYFSKAPLINISSTQIRSMLSSEPLTGKIPKHQNLSELMPDGVIQYIKNL